MGTFFRHSLNKGNEYTTIENELNQISNYVSIQKIRFEDKFDVVYDIDENLLHCTIVKLTIQPLVENYELMCHPAMIDWKLYQISSYNLRRAHEIDIICSQKAKEMTKKIELINYQDIKKI